MGVSSSSMQTKQREGWTGEAGTGESKGKEDFELSVTINAKTKDSHTRTVKTKKVVIKPQKGLETVIGQDGDQCDVVLEDSHLSARHISIGLDSSGNVVLTPFARTYWLIGQGMKNTGLHPLVKGQVVKMGALSLEVTDTCAVKKDSGTEVEDAAAIAADSDGVCYICFEGTSEEGNRLVPSRCACAKLVHKQCLEQWISTKGSRLCSICKSKLPIDFIVEAPYLVLQVVRHMRGLQWTGEREYVVNFSNRELPMVTVGSGNDCDLHLPDPSLSRCHSRIICNEDAFMVEDCQSSAGTFLKLIKSRVLDVDKELQFKVGRTMLNIKVTAKKRAGLWRRKRP